MVQRIKSVPNETKLLVVDEKTDQYYKAKNIVVTGSMPNVAYKKTPNPRPNSTTVVLTPIDNETVNNGSTHSDEDRPSRMSHNMSDSYHSGSGSSSPVSISLKNYQIIVSFIGKTMVKFCIKLMMNNNIHFIPMKMEQVQ